MRLARARETRNSPNGSCNDVAVLLFAYYRIDGSLGTTLTKNLGLALGTIGLAVIWKGAVARGLETFSLVSSLLTLALMSRVEVVPALVAVAPAVAPPNRSALRAAVAPATAAGCAVATNLILGRILMDRISGQAPFANFAYALYGLVVGGKGWGQVLIDHPQAGERTELFRLTLWAFQKNPFGLVIGCLRMWREYLPPNMYHAFSFTVTSRMRKCSSNLLCLQRVRAGSVRTHSSSTTVRGSTHDDVTSVVYTLCASDRRRVTTLCCDDAHYQRAGSSRPRGRTRIARLQFEAGAYRFIDA
jgi:hypothetical protein